MESIRKSRSEYDRETLTKAQGLLAEYGVVAGCEYIAECIDEMKAVGDESAVVAWKRTMTALIDLSDIMLPDDIVH